MRLMLFSLILPCCSSYSLLSPPLQAVTPAFPSGIHRTSKPFVTALSTATATSGRATLPKMILDPASAWDAYNVELLTHPLTTKSITAAVIIGAGDAAAQSIEGSKTGASFDVFRYVRWAVFGLLLQGPWNHAFYLLLDSALPPTESPFTVTTLEKVGIDQFIQAPIFTCLILYYFALVEGKGFGYAKDQIQNELGGILVKNWSVFLPATVINLAYCPPELRVLFLNCVFFGWVVYLSLFLNEADESTA